MLKVLRQIMLKITGGLVLLPRLSWFLLDRASSYKSRSDRRAGLIEVDFNGTDDDCGLE
jgi:hypothetical protein